MFETGIYFFYEVKNRKLKNHTLYVREINSSNGLMKQERALLTSSAVVVPSIAINAQVTNGNGNLNNVSNISRLSISPIEYNNGTSKIIPRFEIIESNDNSKIVVKYRLKPEKMSKNKSIDKLGFYVFNQSSAIFNPLKKQYLHISWLTDVENVPKQTCHVEN